MTDASPDPDGARTPPQPIWSRPDRGRRGPAPAHTRDAIVSAAVALADAEGIGAVSMRAVAGALGTGAGSLYRYLSSRDDLLDLMADRVVGELRPYPEPDAGWLDAMLLLGRRQLALHQRHRWLLDVTPRPSGLGPGSLAWFEACLAIMEPVACTTTAKFEAIAMMTGVVSLVARSEAAPASSPFAGADLGRYPHLAAAFAAPPGLRPGQDLFERSLRALLTGLLAADRAPG